MPLISQDDAETLRTIFDERMQDDVTITYFTQRESPLFIPGATECQTCGQTRELLQEVADLSEKISLDVKDFVADSADAEEMGIERIPAFVLQGHTQGAVRFFGIPAGYEFATLVEDLVDVSTGATDLSTKTRDALGEIDEDIHIQVFVTPT